MAFVAAVAGVNAAAVLGVAREAREIARRSGICRLKKGVDIGEVGVGDGLRGERRHLAGRLADVARKIGKGAWRRSKCGSDGALALGAVAGGAHVDGECV